MAKKRAVRQQEGALGQLQAKKSDNCQLSSGAAVVDALLGMIKLHGGVSTDRLLTTVLTSCTEWVLAFSATLHIKRAVSTASFVMLLAGCGADLKLSATGEAGCVGCVFQLRVVTPIKTATNP